MDDIIAELDEEYDNPIWTIFFSFPLSNTQ